MKWTRTNDGIMERGLKKKNERNLEECGGMTMGWTEGRSGEKRMKNLCEV